MRTNLHVPVSSCSMQLRLNFNQICSGDFIKRNVLLVCVSMHVLLSEYLFCFVASFLSLINAYRLWNLCIKYLGIYWQQVVRCSPLTPKYIQCTFYKKKQLKKKERKNNCIRQSAYEVRVCVNLRPPVSLKAFMYLILSEGVMCKTKVKLRKTKKSCTVSS